MESGTIPSLVWALGSILLLSFNPFRQCFPWLWMLTCIYRATGTLMNTWRGSLQFSFCAPFSSLGTVLQILSLGSQFHLPNLIGNLSGLVWVLFPWAMVSNYCKAVNHKRLNSFVFLSQRSLFLAAWSSVTWKPLFHIFCLLKLFQVEIWIQFLLFQMSKILFCAFI